MRGRKKACRKNISKTKLKKKNGNKSKTEFEVTHAFSDRGHFFFGSGSSAFLNSGFLKRF